LSGIGNSHKMHFRRNLFSEKNTRIEPWVKVRKPPLVKKRGENSQVRKIRNGAIRKEGGKKNAREGNLTARM